MRKAIFPGTFDPFTIGHYSVVERALTFMDEIVIGIGINENKNTYFPIEKREEMIRELYKDEPRIKVMSYDCLTIDFAQEVGARFIVRGIRTVKDFEYEETIADINRKLAGIETKEGAEHDHDKREEEPVHTPVNITLGCIVNVRRRNDILEDIW